MEDLGTCFGILLQDPDLRRALLDNAGHVHRSRPPRQGPALSSALRRGLAQTLRACATYVEPASPAAAQVAPSIGTRPVQA